MRRGHTDVNVQRERRLPACELAHGAVHDLVARLVRYLHVAPRREGMRARSGRPQASRFELLAEPRTEPAQLLGCLGDSGVNARGELDDPRMSLSLDATP